MVTLVAVNVIAIANILVQDQAVRSDLDSNWLALRCYSSDFYEQLTLNKMYYSTFLFLITVVVSLHPTVSSNLDFLFVTEIFNFVCLI